LIPTKCYVIRDSTTVQIDAINLVYGDICYIRSGDKIPADVVLFSCNELKVDNSSLTGEAEPQPRTTKNTEKNPLEAHNLAFNGTLAVNGEGYGVVVRTGDHTVIGQIASLTQNEERRESPMSVEIENFVKLIASVAGVVAIIFFLIALLSLKVSGSIALNFAIGTFTSFVPEGLPATVTVLLTNAAKKMSSKNVLVKDLQGVETLGAITLLATDKTGTLTRNQMTVTYIWTGLKLYFAQSQSATEIIHAEQLDTNDAAVDEMLHMSVLCSRARFESETGNIQERAILGDATEAGLLRNGALKLTTFAGVLDRFPKVMEIPFNSTNKYAMTIHRKKHDKGFFMIYLKGAAEKVLKLCNTFYNNVLPADANGVKKYDTEPLTDDHIAKFNDTYTFMASKGHRVLAFAALALDAESFPEDFVFSKEPLNFPQNNLTFYGLVSLEDPPKHGVREAIGHCREAGIKVMMVTGDHPLTAEAIGRKINLMLQDTKIKIAEKRGWKIEAVPESDVHAIVIHGEQIDDLTTAEWENIFSKEEIIFARTSPKHKLQIVKHAQSLGHIVGVTGDGVNDSPALKKADLGIAMNESGSDVSKEAAAMILIDDNFASTVNGIEEGRLIFQNLKKSIQYTLSHSMPEGF
jgi:sodium/potassium-transporting ATPase subunit alpha